ncbi:GNAT family N-acetyltransferase [Kribbella sp. NBC_01505]|uniref:GNAT family N-acetyltransferase n=1 Tax=Kribbella sp. NBC_01505 TaxID=2903580 RepID=UPI003867174C
MSGAGSRLTPNAEIVAVRPQDDELINAAIELGNTARATLGHLPFAAYHDAADAGTLLVALADGDVVGYSLFGLARRRIRLAHLCVAQTAQHQGVARLLVQAVSERYADYLGIRVRCRRDYGLAQMWINLGFRQLGERPGRGRDAQPLTDWWLDHGHLDLYAVDTNSVLVKAAIDMNILRNWLEPGRPGHIESAALLEEQLSDRLQLFRTHGLDAEIETIRGALRQQCLAKIQPLIAAPRDPARYSLVHGLLLTAAATEIPGYPRHPQDEFDLQHVAAAIAGGLNVFVTLDAELTRALGPEAGRRGMSVLHPTDVLVRIDELARAEAYRPADLGHTRYTQRLLGTGEDHLVESLANVSGGERPRSILTAARKVALDGGDRIGVFGPNGELSAYYGLQEQGPVLNVTTLRVTNAYIGDTLIRHLLFDLRRTARDRGIRVVAIDCTRLQSAARSAAINDGFREHNGSLITFVLDAVGDASVIGLQAIEAARAVGLAPPSWIRSGMLAIPAAELEQNWWPAKLVDSALPTYLIPIRQTFSTELLDVPSALLERDDTLGLNREHVYYRSPGTQRLQAPARILWYMSATGSSVAQQAAIIACSHLDAVHVGPAEDLHNRFRHLGVWRLEDVMQAARNDLAQALRFTSTEIFPRQILLRQFRQIAKELDQSGAPPQSPRLIPADLFATIYREGFST